MALLPSFLCSDLVFSSSCFSSLLHQFLTTGGLQLYRRPYSPSRFSFYLGILDSPLLTWRIIISHLQPSLSVRCTNVFKKSHTHTPWPISCLLQASVCSHTYLPTGCFALSLLLYSVFLISRLEPLYLVLSPCTDSLLYIAPTSLSAYLIAVQSLLTVFLFSTGSSTSSTVRSLGSLVTPSFDLRCANEILFSLLCFCFDSLVIHPPPLVGLVCSRFLTARSTRCNTTTLVVVIAGIECELLL